MYRGKMAVEKKENERKNEKSTEGFGLSDK